MEGRSARKVRKDFNVKIFVLVAVLIIALGTAGIFGFFMFKNTTVIGDNVYVNSISVGGLTVEEATQKIQDTVNDTYFEKSVNVEYKGEKYGVDLTDAVKIDAKETAKDAFGKSGSPIAKIFKKDKLTVPFSLEENTENIYSKAVNHYAEIDNEGNVFVFNDDYTEVQVDASKIDSLADIEETLELIIENAENDVYTDVKAVVLKPSDDDFAEELYTRLARPAVDASVGINEDKSTYIIAETVGIKADKDEFLKLYKANNGRFTINVQPIHPKITHKDLDIEFYQDVLGSYTSAYNMGLVNRTKNVTLAANLVNETIIMPGKKFSYNGVVGKRSAERGFVEATVYTGEGTEEGLGGGICQVSSTIYCAQLRANLKTVSRTNHSYTVAYVPLGQDATVVYGALDYIFENDTNYPVKIQAYANGGYLTVKIMGTKIDKSLTYDVVSVTNSTIAKQEVQKEDPTLPKGETQVKQNGQNGAVVSTYKVYYKDSVEQKREYIGKSTYKPMNKIILVGTAEVEEVPAEGEVEVSTDVVGEENPENTTPDDDTNLNPDEETQIPVDEEVDIPTSDTGL